MREGGKQAFAFFVRRINLNILLQRLSRTKA